MFNFCRRFSFKPLFTFNNRLFSTNIPSNPNSSFRTSLLFGTLTFIGVGGFWAYNMNKYGSFRETWTRFENYLDTKYFIFNNPGLFKKYKLLPATGAPHYTVVVDLKDLFYLRKDGEGQLRPQLRPYMDVFLEELSQKCEVIIWSSIDDPRVQEWIEKLDKRSPCFHSVLYFSECTVKCGNIIKDLRRLNRPLENVIHLCSSPTFAAYQPENALFLQTWDGDVDDASLLDVYMYLQYIIQNNNPATTDARDYLKKFSTMDVAEANREIRKKFHYKIIENNKRTKAAIAEMKRMYGLEKTNSLTKILN